jgi:hypothetical protein
MLTLDHVRRLKGTTFKVLGTLAGLFATDTKKQGSISTRDLAEAAGIERRNVQYALDELTALKLIRIVPGRGPKPPTFILDFLLTEKITGVILTPVAESSGVKTTPVAEENQSEIHRRLAEIHSWVASKRRQYGATGVKTTPVADLFGESSGVKLTPLEAEGKAESQAAGPPASARVRTDFDFDLNLIDQGKERQAEKADPEPPDFVAQLLNAREHDFDARVIEQARKALVGYQRSTLARPENRNIQPPTGDLVAQILTACESHLGRLHRLLEDMMVDRVPAGHSFGLYRTIALQKIHGIEPKVLKERTRQLQEVKAADRATRESATQLPLTAEAPGADPQFRNQLLGEIAERRHKGARG